MTRTTRTTRTPRRSHSFSGAAVVLTIAVIIPFAIMLSLCYVWGWRLEFVRTGSMEPTYPVGSLLVASPIDAADVEAGMPITYADPNRGRIGNLSTHRIVKVKRSPDGQVSFVTKGDANPRKDATAVPPENIRARVRWHVPRLGAILWGLRGPWGVALFLGVPAALLVIGEVRDRRARSRSDQSVAPSTATAGATDATCATCGVGVWSAHRYCHDCGSRQRDQRVPGDHREQLVTA